MPKETILKFSDGQGQFKAPFVIYADFESILKSMSTCSNDPTIPYTNQINKQTPSGFCTYSAFAYGNLQNPEFRSTCIKHYGLDPANFYTSPGLAWKACLKKMGIRLELLTDPDMLLMFDRGIRGGITQSIHRYVEANNKYMDKFDPEKPSSYIQYLDANNLYGWAMFQPLPTGGFKWFGIGIDQVHKLSKREDYGYILEVDVKYPTEIHDSHDELPF